MRTAFLLLVLLFITIQSIAQKGLIKLTPDLKQEFITAHNKWRSDVGTPELKWSVELENFAANWAITNGKKGCKMVHRKNNEYGENLYWSKGTAFSPKDAVDSWGSEIEDFKKNKPFSMAQMKAGHYTQVVWRTTTEVGCAAFQCNSEILVVCNYNPAGNFIGVHPYKK